MEGFSWFKGIEEYVNALSSGDAVPGGGSAAAAEASFGAALIMMAIRTTMRLKKTDPAIIPALQNNLNEIEASFEELKTLIQEDSIAYQKYVTRKKEAKTNPEISLDEESKAIAMIPIQTALGAMKVLKNIEAVKSGISQIIVSDMLCAQHMLKSSLRCSAENMNINLPFVSDESLKDLLKQTIEQCEKAWGE
ncbi:formiminotetrahydrofolate cyclodeaminase [Elusimicrobium posterum]|uniref:cyclodeaminase/cyclohydrolase family protein n=1 Tax=Elusimicrobium posterum TaxID=3116653 RepID=UPI003C7644B3